MLHGSTALSVCPLPRNSAATARPHTLGLCRPSLPQAESISGDVPESLLVRPKHQVAALSRELQHLRSWCFPRHKALLHKPEHMHIPISRPPGGTLLHQGCGQSVGNAVQKQVTGAVQGTGDRRSACAPLTNPKHRRAGQRPGRRHEIVLIAETGCMHRGQCAVQGTCDRRSVRAPPTNSTSRPVVQRPGPRCKAGTCSGEGVQVWWQRCTRQKRYGQVRPGHLPRGSTASADGRTLHAARRAPRSRACA